MILIGLILKNVQKNADTCVVECAIMDPEHEKIIPGIQGIFNPA
jgi:hypothetical protein